MEGRACLLSAPRPPLLCPAPGPCPAGPCAAVRGAEGSGGHRARPGPGAGGGPGPGGRNPTVAASGETLLS